MALLSCSTPSARPALSVVLGCSVLGGSWSWGYLMDLLAAEPPLGRADLAQRFPANLWTLFRRRQQARDQRLTFGYDDKKKVPQIPERIPNTKD